MNDYGVAGNWPVRREHRIRWAECDPYGHVNHAAYLTLCEDLRCSYWLALGGSFAPDGFGPVLAQLEAKYLRPLAFDDQVLVTMRTVSLRRTSLVQEYAVWKAGPCFTCRSVLVAIRGSTGERVPLPAAMRAQLIRDGATEET